MNIVVDPKAAEWLAEEMKLKQGDAVQLFVRIGGCSTVQSGYSLGIARTELPDAPALRTEIQGVSYYMVHDHLWYLDGKDLHIRYDDHLNEIRFDV